MSCKITVVVPVYNTAKYLPSCVGSLINQSVDSYEVLLINDGSTDNSLEAAEELQRKHPDIIRVISQKNKGLGGARNTGIDNASGEFIMFVDSDDTVKPNALASLCNEITKAQADIIIYGLEYVDEQGNTLSKTAELGEERLVFTLSERPLILATDPSACNKLFRTSLFRDNNIYFPEHAWYEDLRTIPKLMLEAEKMVFIKEYFYNYLQRPGSIMHSTNIDKNSDMLDSVEEVVSYYEKRGAYDKYFTELEFLALFHIMTLCTYRVAVNDPKHPLLGRFYDYTERRFPGYRDNRYIGEYLSLKNRTLYNLSVKKKYRSIGLLNKANTAAKKILK